MPIRNWNLNFSGFYVLESRLQRSQLMSSVIRKRRSGVPFKYRPKARIHAKTEVVDQHQLPASKSHNRHQQHTPQTNKPPVSNLKPEGHENTHQTGNTTTLRQSSLDTSTRLPTTVVLSPGPLSRQSALSAVVGATSSALSLSLSLRCLLCQNGWSVSLPLLNAPDGDNTSVGSDEVRWCLVDVGREIWALVVHDSVVVAHLLVLVLVFRLIGVSGWSIVLVVWSGWVGDGTVGRGRN